MVMLLDDALTVPGSGHAVADQRCPTDSFQQFVVIEHGDLLPDSFVR
jgi:hypothetical protein